MAYMEPSLYPWWLPFIGAQQYTIARNHPFTFVVFQVFESYLLRLDRNSHHRGNLTVDQVQEDKGHGGVSRKEPPQTVLKEQRGDVSRHVGSDNIAVHMNTMLLFDEYSNACTHTYMNTYLPTYLPTYLHTYLLTCLHT